MPITGADANALEIATGLIRAIGFDPVVVGSLAFGRYLLPVQPLGIEDQWVFKSLAGWPLGEKVRLNFLSSATPNLEGWMSTFGPTEFDTKVT